AGMGGERTTWPKLLRERTSLEIRNLSFPGAKVQSASKKVSAELRAPVQGGEWVLLEIGGNDLLDDTSAEAFGRDLEALLIAARGDSGQPRRLIMLELPIPPGRWAFGAKQRQLAAKFSVLLIPKRLLAGLILDDDNVLDGLHLSRAGHECMTDALLPWLGQ